MAFLALCNGRSHSLPTPASGWDLVAVGRIVGPQPIISTLKTQAGEFRLIRSKLAQVLNLAASMETGLLLKGNVLVIAPGETIVRTQA